MSSPTATRIPLAALPLPTRQLVARLLGLSSDALAAGDYDAAAKYMGHARRALATAVKRMQALAEVAS